MPSGNGTGSYRFGPGSSRRMGKCKGFFNSSERLNSRTFGLIGALIPIFTALIRDVINPDGLIRSFDSKRLLPNTTKNKNAIDAKYTIQEETENNEKFRYDISRTSKHEADERPRWFSIYKWFMR